MFKHMYTCQRSNSDSPCRFRLWLGISMLWVVHTISIICRFQKCTEHQNCSVSRLGSCSHNNVVPVQNNGQYQSVSVPLDVTNRVQLLINSDWWEAPDDVRTKIHHLLSYWYKYTGPPYDQAAIVNLHMPVHGKMDPQCSGNQQCYTHYSQTNHHQLVPIHQPVI